MPPIVVGAMYSLQELLVFLLLLLSLLILYSELAQTPDDESQRSLSIVAEGKAPTHKRGIQQNTTVRSFKEICLCVLLLDYGILLLQSALIIVLSIIARNLVILLWAFVLVQYNTSSFRRRCILVV